MTKEEMAKAYAEGFTEEYREIAYDAFLCGYGAKCTTEIPKDLEEAAKKYAHCPFTDDDGNFHEDAFDVNAYHDFIAGAKWDRQKMLKEAVEGEIQMRYSGCLCAKTIRAINEDKFKLGDKVRIIVCKKEDEK